MRSFVCHRIMILFLAILGFFSTAAFADAQGVEDLFLSPDASSSQAASTFLHSVELAELEQQLLDLGLDPSEVDIALVSEDGELNHVVYADFSVAARVVAVVIIAAGIYVFIKPLR